MSIGGVEKSLLDLLRHVDYNRYNLDLLLLEDKEDYLDEIPPPVRIIYRNLTNTHGSVVSSLKRCLVDKDWFCFRMRLILFAAKILGDKWLRLARDMFVGSNSYDIAVGYRPGMSSDLVAHAVNATRKLAWWHHGRIRMDATQRAKFEQSCTYFDNIVTVSDGCSEMLKREFPTIKRKLVVIPNIIDVRAINAKAESYNPYDNESIFRIVTVCRLTTEKHVENAVYAAEQLRQQGICDFIWHIIGDGPERENVETLILEKGLQNYFSVEGNLSNPYPYLKHGDLYVHTSYAESQGIAILEAMAVGLPCVVTRCLGPEGYIRNGKNGLLVEKGASFLSQGIAYLKTRPRLYKSLQANTHCPMNYSGEKVMSKIDTFIHG